VTYDKILEVRDPAELIPPRVLRESIKSIVADKAVFATGALVRGSECCREA